MSAPPRLFWRLGDWILWVLRSWDLGLLPWDFSTGKPGPFGFPSGHIGLWAITQCLVDRSEVSLLSGAWVCPFGDNYQRPLEWYLVMPAEYP